MTLTARIVDVVRDEPHSTAPEVAAEVGASVATVGRTLYRLVLAERLDRWPTPLTGQGAHVPAWTYTVRP